MRALMSILTTLAMCVACVAAFLAQAWLPLIGFMALGMLAPKIWLRPIRQAPLPTVNDLADALYDQMRARHESGGYRN